MLLLINPIILTGTKLIGVMHVNKHVLNHNHRVVTVMCYFVVFYYTCALSMDKLIIKRGSTSIDISIDTSIIFLSPSLSFVSGNNIKMNDETTIKHGKYNDDYLNFGFMCIGDERNLIPQCTVCVV